VGEEYENSEKSGNTKTKNKKSWRQCTEEAQFGPLTPLHTKSSYIKSEDLIIVSISKGQELFRVNSIMNSRITM
jgi:hypothetical protein